MVVALSQEDYWSLFGNSTDSRPDGFDATRHCPVELGEGYYWEIQLRDGLELAIAEYESYDDIIIESCDREHPIEYTFHLSGCGQSLSESVSYMLYGSGIAPGEYHKQVAHQPIKLINVHIQPDVFQAFVGNSSEPIPGALQHLIGEPNQIFYTREGQATLAMQINLQQILQCPYEGLTKRLFLESKIWELLALILEQELECRQGKPLVVKLKPDDVDRLYQAKAIVQQNLDNPPSLMQLAHQVGLNECTLKQGFRQVFKTTVFGYLRQCRMEKAKLLLMQGQMSIYEAAQAVGYSSQSRFANVFRKTFGINPKAFSRRS
jgi:AraC family transcriptional regulator, transcriptional activator of the genes for pyochelin and ferripyochelin receptors